MYPPVGELPQQPAINGAERQLAGVGATLAFLGAEGEPFYPGIYAVDPFSQLLKLGVVVGLVLTLLAGASPGSFREHARADTPMFLFFSALGMMMLVSATELLTLFVALELSAYALYILAALHRMRRIGSEAGAKYILFGAAASAVTIYGISLIYGATRTTDLTEIGPHVERDMALVKVAGTGENRIEALRLADVYRARVVDSTTQSFVFEVTGNSDKVASFIELMREVGLVEVARTGVVAIGRGKEAS